VTQISDNNAHRVAPVKCFGHTGNFEVKDTQFFDHYFRPPRRILMRSVGLLVARVVFGCYLAAHGAQKLFGWFGGRGLDATGEGFASMGLRPGKLFAGTAGASEFAGGLLTATGIANPLGPLILTGTMAVASTTHRKNGAFTSKGGFELPLTNMAMAVALMSAGTGALRLGPGVPKSFARKAALGGVILAAGTVTQLLLAARKKEQQRIRDSFETTDAATAS
jgi:putative oxidoreductase